MNAEAQVSIYLPDARATLALGEKLGRIFCRLGVFPAVLFLGKLGAGKTTMIRGIVSSLPGANEAEVSSPSFNLVNIYPTSPETAHIDLYRLEYQEPDDYIQEIMQTPGTLVLVEWSEYLVPAVLPRDRVTVNLVFAEKARIAEIAFFGAGKRLAGLIK